MIPAEVIAGRAVECKSYSRALFHWEQHIRNHRKNVTDPDQSTILLERLQDIYTQIDEPDGIEGISAHLHVLDIDQQILGHRKAGRWAAAQSWYEIKLADSPDNTDLQVNLLTCLKESGQHDVLLNYVEGMHTTTQSVARILPFATEAAWSTGKWASLEKYTKMVPNATGDDFNIGIGSALLTLYGNNSDEFASAINFMRGKFARSLSNSTTTSLSSCHDTMLKFHVLTELEMIASTTPAERPQVLASLDRRLEVIGAYLNDKQYLLGIRRAAMQLSSSSFTTGDVASAWLTSARLARKGNAINQSFNAVLHASQLGDESATIEHARLLWKEGHPRKAIQSLQGAIDSNAFISHNKNIDVMTSVIGVEQTNEQNLLTARAHLLLAKWLDSAGQTHSLALRAQYQTAAKTHHNWEKGHYYLGRHYNKLLQSEKALPPESQAESYLRGETARLVIENYLRALSFGTKYIYQTLPRILTLWLDLGAQVNQPLDSKYGSSKEFVTRVTNGRKESLTSIHNRFTKYVVKMPAYMFYTALPQIMSRINHANTEVFKYLTQMIVKTVSTYPQHALWGLLAVATSMQADRKARGGIVIAALRGNAKKLDSGGNDIKMLLKAGESVAQQLIVVCNAGEFHGNRTSWASLTRDLGFNHKVTPSPLAMPVENVLTATLPTLTGDVRSHKAFSRDIVTITSFEDEVMILSSLQKPRKLTARGSDGKKYGLMCKPKDDLRKDQRLMEFNSMINRSLKRDAESSRRQLYIKTYAVTPLNEECGIIEWVDGLKTLRDLLLTLYKPVGISPNYREIEMLCDEASKDEKKMALFSEKVLGQFPPIFHQWFVQQFPEPPAWFAARLRYTRSCAVMSMIGTILGLGDRHGENILFEEGNGGTFHVDFNCLFDKGLTFVKPERVPFRLTHNMVDAMGIYGYEGPFRKSSELTLKLLRQHEETLMTILEAFVYDPTLDLLTKKPEKKKKEGAFNVPTTPQGVLDTINRKVKGLLTGESVPLGVEGQVDELIKQATSLQHLAGMYIGWCAFF
ncbi:protein kinase Rad3 (phosphatidylinositol 3) [Phlyctema vagabunda]|uniref:non-specific serine/threonine protein kinase n=1 Tax=Phlyctema vagabunda TaxID=108571 RepID=A0ABR4P6C1_9HELO